MTKAGTVDHLTDAESAAIQEFERAICEIPDWFDADFCADLAEIEIEHPGHLAAIASLLHDWWSDLDTLDAVCGETGVDGPAATPAAARYLNTHIELFFAARQNVLYAAAKLAGVQVPRPDHDGGEIETSGNSRGFYGYHDPEFDYQIQRRWRETRAS